MNREIKFRIWDRQQRKFHTDADWGISLRGNHIIGFSSHDSWNDDRGYKINLSNQDNLIVQQYTGLKDKNGIPIYEGDIVEIGDRKKEVIFNIGIFYIDENYGDIVTVSEVDNIIKVIGNIFENPELIKNNDNNNQ